MARSEIRDLPSAVLRTDPTCASLSEATQACFMSGANSIFTGDRLLNTPSAGEEPMRACSSEATE